MKLVLQLDAFYKVLLLNSAFANKIFKKYVHIFSRCLISFGNQDLQVVMSKSKITYAFIGKSHFSLKIYGLQSRDVSSVCLH